MNGNRLIQEGMLWSPRMLPQTIRQATAYFRHKLRDQTGVLHLTLNPQEDFPPSVQEELSKELNVTISYDREVPTGHVWCPARSQPA